MHEMVIVLPCGGRGPMRGWEPRRHRVCASSQCAAGPAALTPPGNQSETPIPPPAPDLLDQKSGGWGQQCIVTSPPGSSVLAEDFVILVPLPAPKRFAVTVFVVSRVCLKGLILHATKTDVLCTGETSNTI